MFKEIERIKEIQDELVAIGDENAEMKKRINHNHIRSNELTDEATKLLIAFLESQGLKKDLGVPYVYDK